MLHEVAGAERRFHYLLPCHALARVYIDHQAVGVLEIRDGGVPGVQFDGANLDQP